VTDANLVLGRLIPDFFPKIFGKNENEPLDIDASEKAFEKVAEEVNTNFEKTLSLDEIAYGYVVAVLSPNNTVKPWN
jgi:5-oxoprolinase (ATP-hydrolysing)